jgi:hypothetical protein
MSAVYALTLAFPPGREGGLAGDHLSQQGQIAEVDPGVAVFAARERGLQVLLGEQRATG